MSGSKKLAAPGLLKVCIVGSGNWGSAVSKLIGANIINAPEFDKTVKMYVFEEILDATFGENSGKKLTAVINTKHENVKYLKGHRLPDNIVAEPDLVVAAQDADYLIFVLPHQFIGKALDNLTGKIKPSAVGMSLVKGLYNPEKTNIRLLSTVITDKLKIPMGVLMGANVANEVADGLFCETTIAFKELKQGQIFKKLMQTPDFRITVIKDVTNAELCGALKNIVAFAAGVSDGVFGEKTNTKAAIIRLGLMEMMKFAEQFFPGGTPETFLQSCGIGDLVTSCFGGRNRKVGEAFAASPAKTLDDLSKEMLGGQQLQGARTAEEVNYFLSHKGKEKDFPLFTAVHQICKKEMAPNKLIDAIRQHPEHHHFRVSVHGFNDERSAAGKPVFIYKNLLQRLITTIVTCSHLATTLAKHLLGWEEGILYFGANEPLGQGIVSLHPDMVDAINS
ncbi:Glycerol-3-phosphate dehydrogenase [NAD(+)], cytoplasmic [Hypsibius exemplaris]|uniref:Glycerol-3-phosphate dehydrogenase [NAD(+)] n=1 Tax=Hypsibius exemplaris TaxID=2072580 RepID=A0A1W0WFW5_HYPEX|nr:Glycerol-3-phosphate dehydrogenase [NAD(+)], cytoplasmic [Hypsibius exemplaris]